MATYVPVATDPADPVSSRFVGSAAEEFRTLKNRTKGALVVPLTDPVPGFIPEVALRAGKVLGFDAGGNPVVLTVAGTTDPSLRADLAAAGGAALVGNAPAGSIAATTVQAAINELATEKAAAGANTDITSLSGVVTINSAAALHFSDIINGDFRIAQAGTSFAAPVNGSYDLDGWFNRNSSTAVFTVAQVAGSVSDRLARQVTITTADAAVAVGDFVLSSTKIEGFNVIKYVGNTFTVAGRIKTPVTGVHCVALRNSGPDRSYVKEINVTAANTWQDFSFTVTGGLPTAGTWDYTNGTGLEISFAHMVGSTFQTTADAWNTGNFIGTANQVNDCATNSNVWALEKVTLNLGTIAATSEISIDAELRRCQRYYQKSYPIDSAPASIVPGVQFVAASTAGESAPTIVNPVAMRASPTLIIFSPVTGAGGARRNLTTSADEAMTAFNVNSSVQHSGSGTAHTTGNVYSYHYTKAAML